MKIFVLLVVVFSVACSEKVSVGVGEEKKYELICKHPVGHIVRYPVTYDTFWRPSNVRGGIFRFETTDGRIVRSSFCHGEAKY